MGPFTRSGVAVSGRIAVFPFTLFRLDHGLWTEGQPDAVWGVCGEAQSILPPARRHPVGFTDGVRETLRDDLLHTSDNQAPFLQAKHAEQGKDFPYPERSAAAARALLAEGSSRLLPSPTHSSSTPQQALLPSPSSPHRTALVSVWFSLNAIMLALVRSPVSLRWRCCEVFSG